MFKTNPGSAPAYNCEFMFEPPFASHGKSSFVVISFCGWPPDPVSFKRHRAPIITTWLSNCRISPECTYVAFPGWYLNPGNNKKISYPRFFPKNRFRVWGSGFSRAEILDLFVSFLSWNKTYFLTKKKLARPPFLPFDTQFLLDLRKKIFRKRGHVTHWNQLTSCEEYKVRTKMSSLRLSTQNKYLRTSIRWQYW